jgi:PPOX class probable F420-dependent enzyme
MTDLNDTPVQELLSQPNFAVISTYNEDGSILSTVIWFDTEDGALAVNSAKGRKWPTNLDRDPRATLCVIDSKNPYSFVEVRGTASAGTTDGADAHIDGLAKRYLDQDKYPFRQPGEERVKYVITPDHVRFVKQ